ncbi:HTH-type transcriptional regulator LutR [Polystyrenella longa]|uniref:HTH-type transcriptional regulator LutR n=1 Tax=Polystyrenella longa TaxID=2528007 RepID=A0A518CQW8_9PLAN|nr:GntR family transcriptional regulator [Polystyrenella longa]QDU81594.1 HTH-type transcriptional regulator LutR [Polystyrenella longa]
MDDSCRSTAYEAIREAILQGDFREGDRVSEYAFAKKLELSRAPIREAINQLVTQGLLEQFPGSGTFVRKLTFAELEEVYELREWLECSAITSPRYALKPADLEAIQSACDEIALLIKETQTVNQLDEVETSSFVKRLYLADARFHLFILRGARNKLALQTMQDRLILEQIWSSNRVSLEAESLERLHSEHVHILDKLRKQDYEAAVRFLRKHIRDAINNYRELDRDQKQDELLDTYFSTK